MHYITWKEKAVQRPGCIDFFSYEWSPSNAQKLSILSFRNPLLLYLSRPVIAIYMYSMKRVKTMVHVSN